MVLDFKHNVLKFMVHNALTSPVSVLVQISEISAERL